MLLYFSQLTHTKNGINQNRSFPLAAGVISQYLLSKFGNELEIKVFKIPEKLNEALTKRKPDVLLFSNYLWNENISCGFSNLFKKQYPNTLSIMGGPNLSFNKETNIKFLNDNPSIDKLVFYDGEIPACLIIEDFLKYKDIKRIRNLNVPNTMSICNDDVIYNTNFKKDAPRIINKENKTLDDIPSPYLSGLFDEFFLDGEWPLLETMRGCPFLCSFCQQGNEYFSVIRNFSIDRVSKEIEYMAKKIYNENIKIDTLWITDPNFAMYKRDSEILKKIREVQDKYNFPQRVLCSTGKNNAELIIQSISIVKKGSLLLRNAVQSLDEETLKAVNRSNIKLEAYKKIQNHITELGMESNADIMLGLPKETKRSHFDGIFKLIDSNTKEISCLQTIMLKGTRLEENEYVKLYGIKTKKRIMPACFKTYNILNEKISVIEFDKIIIENNSLSFNDYLECRKLHLLIVIFHNTRLLKPVYELFNNLNIKKSLIYEKLLNSKNKDFNLIVNAFLDETKNELFDDFSEFKKLNKNLDEVSSYKVFRSLSISFYKKKSVILSVIKEVLTDILQINDNFLIEDIINILDLSIISPFEKMEDNTYEIKSVYLKNIFGNKINIYISERQKTILKTLYKIFNNDEDRVNIMAWHLKPENMTKQLLFNK